MEGSIRQESTKNKPFSCHLFSLKMLTIYIMSATYIFKYTQYYFYLASKHYEP